jgi:hypothetical protein
VGFHLFGVIFSATLNWRRIEWIAIAGKATQDCIPVFNGWLTVNFTLSL